MFRRIKTLQCVLMLGSKLAQIYIRLSIWPIGQQEYDVSWAIIS